MTQDFTRLPGSPEAVIVDTTRSPHARLRPVPISAVRLSDTFWEPRRQINRRETIPGQYAHCEATGRLDNFRRAAGKRPDLPFQGIFFNDSDVYKWLEAACWALATDDDPASRQRIDTVIGEIAAAQQPDGYLNTYFMFNLAGERWANFDKHEMYCAGHLFQAAVAHYRVTGERNLLDVATSFADYLDRTFGPEEHGKRVYADGHEEVEMALVELARATGEERYRTLAQFFVDVRGHGQLTHPNAHFGSAYYQDDAPFRELAKIRGHAVRAVYYTAGATDLYAESGEAALHSALDRLWHNMVVQKMYVSGGIGARWEGEAFGEDYELPNDRAYTETCAAIGSVMWNHRLLALAGEACYADLLELTLYNAVLPGISLDGKQYFYQNPLADQGAHRRQEWFGCACCPPNVARLLAQLPGYFYSRSPEGIWTHLYAAGTATIALATGRAITLTTATTYPWDGTITTTVDGGGEWSMFLRIPAWAAGAQIMVNGQHWQHDITPGSYAELRRDWQPGDVVVLTLPMAVRLVAGHPYVTENVGCAAIMRGPLLYCVEGVDHVGIDLRELALPADATFDAAPHPTLPGILALTTEAQRVATPVAWHDTAYREADKIDNAEAMAVKLSAIPYYAWANRDAGQMQVWLRLEPRPLA